MKSIVFVILTLFLWVSYLHAGEIEELKRMAEETVDTGKKALLYKKIGDYYISLNDLNSAAEAYTRALLSGRDVFTIDERLYMTVRISWAGKLKEALEEIEYILSEAPDNLDARIHYARVLSWSGRLDDALREIDTVLKKEPDNRDALLVKANTLRWKGNHKEAINIYNDLLKSRDDFDTRLGLAYSLIAISDIISAEENIRLLKPSYPYQEKDLSKLKVYLKSVKRPQVHMEYSYYNDNDDNITRRYSAGINTGMRAWKFNLNYKLTAAEDNMHENRAHSFNIGGYRKFNSVGTGATIGMTFFDNKNSSALFTGDIKVDIEIKGTSLFLNLTKDAITDTAQLIEREIKFTEAGIKAIRPLMEKILLESLYRFRDYSDGNQSHDLEGSLRYTIMKNNPSISMGYRIRYLDFKKQTGNGYFDPDNFISHQFFLSFYYEGEGIYIFFEPYTGYQSFSRYGKERDELFTGGSMTFGYGIGNRLSIELNAERGDYAAGATAGFKYWKAGGGFKFIF